MTDALGDRMKMYEAAYAQKAMPLLPVCARIDGRAFHTWTRGLDRPWDDRLCGLMHQTAQTLMIESGAQVGYTQSDEINLIFYRDRYESQVFFDGKIPKLTSVLASMATAVFNSQRLAVLPFHNRLAYFDCRVWQVPTLEEACNVLIWRELDATRNSLEMLSRNYFSHRQLHEKSQKDMHEMLHGVGVNWNDLPDHKKRGSYFLRQPVVRMGSQGPVVRHEVRMVPLPPILRIENRAGFFFRGEPVSFVDKLAQLG